MKHNIPDPGDHELSRWEEEGGTALPQASEPPQAEPRPFEIALFEALSFTAAQVKKVDVSVGPRSQTVTFKFGLTTDQVAQLDAMAARK